MTRRGVAAVMMPIVANAAAVYRSPVQTIYAPLSAASKKRTTRSGWHDIAAMLYAIEDGGLKRSLRRICQAEHHFSSCSRNSLTEVIHHKDLQQNT